MALRAALCGVLALAAAEGPAGVKEDIFAAVRRDDAAAIERLVGADKTVLDETGPGGQSPTMHGVLQGKSKAVATLIKLGADLTVGEKDGYTPMHGAGFQGRAKVAKLLAEAGVDVNAVHADGYAPIHRCCFGDGHPQTLRVFLEAGVSPTLPSVEDTVGRGGRAGTTCNDVRPPSLRTLDPQWWWFEPRHELISRAES